MLDEAIEVFEAELERWSEQWLYDNYVPSPGTYILLKLEEDFSIRNIFDIGKTDKEREEEYQLNISEEIGDEIRNMCSCSQVIEERGIENK